MHPVTYLIAISSASAISLNTYWNESDTKRLSGIFEVMLKTRNNGFESLHYIMGTLKILGVAPPRDSANVACKAVKEAQLIDLDSLYHAVALLSVLPDCVFDSVAGATEIVEKLLLDKASSGERLYRALSIADHLKIKVNQAALDKALSASMRIDDDATNLAWIMNAAAFLEKEVGVKYFDKIANLVAQADEVDGTYLRFDDSIVSTAVAVRGIVRLSKKQGKKPAVLEKKLLQLANNLLSRKQATAPKIIYHLVGALKALTDNAAFVPIVISLEGPVEVASDQPIKIAVTNVFGEPINADNVHAEVKSAVSNQTLISNLEPIPSDSRFWTFSPDRIPIINDFVRLDIKIKSKDKRLIGTTSSHVLIKKSRNLVVNDLELGISKTGEEILENSIKSITPFTKIKDVVDVDSTKHLHISFSVRYENDAGSYLKPHQSFVMFKHENGNEVFYTANLVKDDRYAIDIDLSKAYKDFDGLSGIYTAYLIVGDAFIQTPLSWPFADFMISVPPVARKPEPACHRVDYEPKPEMRHTFRKPEKRPAVILSDSFTILGLAPLLLLLILWNRIGVNCTKMPPTVWVALFHAGLSAMFGLYVIFWLRLNMFDTLKYLSVIGSFTFIAGNQVLRAVAAKK